jgi:rare lipoprotein A
MGAGLTITPGFGRALLRMTMLAALVAPILAACGSVGESGVKRAIFSSKEFGVSSSPRVTKAKYPPRGGGRYLASKPYVVRGQTYRPVDGPGYVAQGEASWYGQDFHGRRTANGEIFGAYYLTAASPVLPVPSYARVINLENGRSVMVRVNDRGPYLQGRIIDLSYEAAQILGYVNKGSAQVEVRYVGPAPLRGDDNRMLMATVNKQTRMERDAETRMAMMAEQRQATQVADADEDIFAGDDVQVNNGRINFADYQEQQRGQASRGSYSGKDLADDVFGLFGYAEEGQATGAEAAIEAMASGELAGPEILNTAGEPITLRLGTFRDSQQAIEVAGAFAMLGAVDEATTTLGGDPATVLTLIRLKPGVSRADVVLLAQQLGLSGVILY